MGLPADFSVDNQRLDSIFRQLQTQHHPDIAQRQMTQADSPLSNLSHEQASAVINTAYQTLKNPDSRATHLLELAGQADGLNDSIRDLDFLDKAMELRISLDQANSDKLPALKVVLQHWIKAVEQDFVTAFTANDWQTAKTATQQLKFLVKLQHDFAKKTDELANDSQHHDDDLYV